MSGRSEILARVRAGMAAKGDAASRRQAAEEWLAARRRGPQPAIAGDLAARFRARAEALASSVDAVAEPAQVPAAVARYLAAGGSTGPLVCAPEMADLDWAGAGLAVAARGAVAADAVGITGCFCAIAETGTLLLISGPQTPATVSLLPETHIAVVPAGRVVATMEDAFALLRAECGGMPRAVNFVSGPSRTGDIEQTLVIGAHGPCRVHVIVTGARTPGLP